MEQTIKLQPIGIFPSDTTTLLHLLNTMTTQAYRYGMIIGRFGKLEGFFTAMDLLQYCMKMGFDYIEDIDQLRAFARMVNKQFTIVTHIPSIKYEWPADTHLLIIKQDNKYMGCIDKATFYEAVAKTQQFQLKHYKTVFQAVPSGIMAVDIQGNITMMNQAGEKISGVPLEKAIGRFITDVVPPKGLLQVLQTGQGQVEKYKVRKRWYISHREPIFDGKQLVGAIGVFEDISKIESLTSELETYRQLVRENEMLMDTSEHGIAIMDPNGDILRQNALFHQFYISIMYEESQRVKFSQALQDIIQNKKTQSTIRMTNRHQQVLDVHFSIITNQEQRTIDRIVVRISNITTTSQHLKKINALQQQLHHVFTLTNDSIVSYSTELTNKIKQIAKVSSSVLIKGAIGTGRSTLAKQIVLNSERKKAPFIEIDCRTKTKNELEYVLFTTTLEGYYLFSLATNGTLYFKNIDYLPYTLQERLASLIEQQASTINIRIMASISTDVSFGQKPNFSEKLYYLINAITFHIPPIAEKPEETKTIIQHFIHLLSEKHHRSITLTADAIQFLLRQQWTENLKEIFSLLERLVLSSHRTLFHAFHIKQLLALQEDISKKSIIVNDILPLKTAVKELEKELLFLLNEKNISYRQMAKILDVNPSTVVRKIRNIKE
ncbi:sigma 54-interacting transcriptional regulator [Lysinibacillus sp. LZ02]|uniref:sigma 54-interacting transcriptional regulator n=1 Tax=Lysinibacillus sp. LZ02 TaxID=3420668 RepID=UPI003D3680E2